MPAARSLFVGWLRQSRTNWTSDAPASSAFWTSSLKTPTPSLYSSRMLWSLVVTGSWGPVCSIPSASAHVTRVLIGGTPNSWATLVEMVSWIIGNWLMIGISDPPFFNQVASQKVQSRHGSNFKVLSQVIMGTSRFCRSCESRGIPSRTIHWRISHDSFWSSATSLTYTLLLSCFSLITERTLSRSEIANVSLTPHRWRKGRNVWKSSGTSKR